MGPTGTGKSAIALMLAKELKGEIISCDSMMVYRGMDIGTAKPSIENRKAVKHHLIDIVEIDQPYNASLYATEATEIISEITSRDTVPILCGGTGLYAKALLNGYHFFPKDEALSIPIEGQLNPRCREELLAELIAIDPVTANRVRNNPKQLIRAVAIVRKTRRPLRNSSSSRKHSVFSGPHWILLPDSQLLRKRIENRTHAMLQNGWIDETKGLVEKGLLLMPTASKALGYAQIAAYLQGQIKSRNDLAEKIIILTCQYAKRQRTWFRHQHPDALKLELKEEWNESKIVEIMLATLDYA